MAENRCGRGGGTSVRLNWALFAEEQKLQMCKKLIWGNRSVSTLFFPFW